MPLLTSPIDGSPMRQIHRYGIEIDVCPTSGGIWLDKGELEKILHLLQEETDERPSAPVRMKEESRHHDEYRHKRDDDDDHRYKERGYYGCGKYYKKRKQSLAHHGSLRFLKSSHIVNGF